jgi:hypothetical protein
VIRVWISEEQVELSLTQLGRQLCFFIGDLLGQLGVARSQLVELDQVSSALLELIPRLDELAILGRFARESARATGIVPDAGLG